MSANSPLGVLVEVQEGAALAVEGPARLLGQAGQGADRRQQGLQPVQRLGAGVPHGLPVNTRKPLISAMASISVSPLVSP